MRRALAIIALALLATGCGRDGRDGNDGRDGSLNMRIINYEINEKHWEFYPGNGPEGLGRHYFYVVNSNMDKDIAHYLNRNTFKGMSVRLEREVEPFVMVPLPSTTIVEEMNGSDIVQHTEVISYDYSADPAEIIIYFVDSRFDDPNGKWPPKSMRFRATFMWP